MEGGESPVLQLPDQILQVPDPNWSHLILEELLGVLRGAQGCSVVLRGCSGVLRAAQRCSRGAQGVLRGSSWVVSG